MTRDVVRPAGLLAAGAAATAVALGPAMHRAGDALFSAHMVQHLLLVTIAAPLLVAGFPGPALLARLPRGSRHAMGRFIRRGRRLFPRRVTALAAWLGHVVVLWAWHVPALYEAALRAPVLHAAEHASLLVTAMAFWAVVAGRRLDPVASVLYLFAAAGQSTALGALLTLASWPSYPVHAPATDAWGLTPLGDQQLAGVIMWVLGGMGYLWAALVILARALRPGEPRSRLRYPTTDAPRSPSI
jgi:cytochrome c oxidase assembly factor CtaG